MGGGGGGDVGVERLLAAAVTKGCRHSRSNDKQLIDGRMRPGLSGLGPPRAMGTVECRLLVSAAAGCGTRVLEPQSDRCFLSCLSSRHVAEPFAPTSLGTVSKFWCGVVCSVRYCSGPVSLSVLSSSLSWLGRLCLLCCFFAQAAIHSCRTKRWDEKLAPRFDPSSPVQIRPWSRRRDLLACRTPGQWVLSPGS